MTGSVGKLDPTVQAQVKGVVLYGDTRNQQTGGSIPGYPKENVLVICAAGDGVCYGTLTVTAAHLSYQDDVPKAAEFLEGKIGAGGASSGSTGTTTSTGSGTSSSSGSSAGGGLFGGGSLGGSRLFGGR